jgi:hypothetical protein
METRLIPPIQSAIITPGLIPFPPGFGPPYPYPNGFGPFMLPMPCVTYEGPPYEVCRPLYRDFPYDHHSYNDDVVDQSCTTNTNANINANVNTKTKKNKNVCSECNKVFKNKKRAKKTQHKSKKV